jgi:hypothetical protein
MYLTSVGLYNVNHELVNPADMLEVDHLDIQDVYPYPELLSCLELRVIRSTPNLLPYVMANFKPTRVSIHVQSLQDLELVNKFDHFNNIIVVITQLIHPPLEMLRNNMQYNVFSYPIPTIFEHAVALSVYCKNIPTNTINAEFISLRIIDPEMFELFIRNCINIKYIQITTRFNLNYNCISCNKVRMTYNGEECNIDSLLKNPNINTLIIKSNRVNYTPSILDENYSLMQIDTTDELIKAKAASNVYDRENIRFKKTKSAK